MNEELQKVVEAGNLAPESAEKLNQLQPGEYCQHKSWGFGKICEWNLLTGQIFIDFGSKKGHPMQLEYAALTLTAVPSHFVRAQLAGTPEAVLARAKEDPAGLVKDVLANFGGRATMDQIASVFVPHGMTAAEFKKFWDTAKKKLRGDEHVHFPAKKNLPIELHDTPVNQGAKLFASVHEARHPKDQVQAIEAVLKALDELSKEIEEMKTLTALIEDAAKKGQRLHAVQAVELLLARDEICARHEILEPGMGALEVADLLKSEQSRLPELFSNIAASKHRKLLAHFRTAFPETWKERSFALALNATPRLIQEIGRFYQAEGEQEAFHEALDRVIRERSTSPEMLLWICKERGADFPELFRPDLFGAVLTCLEQDMLSDITRGTKLHDLIMDDKTLMADLLGDASLDDVRDAVRKLKLTTVFDDLNKRSLLARIIKLHPETESMVTGEQEQEKAQSLVVSWASLEKRRLEFEDLVNRQIPQNTRDISIARSYGDLRENFEFKSAKEQQRVLLRRKSEMERDLSAARGTNFEDVDVSKVSIGTVVTVSEAGSEELETYSILGAWDSIPDKNVVSYQAAIGQALLGKPIGTIVLLPTEQGVRSVKIVAIEAFKNLELLGEAEQAPA